MGEWPIHRPLQRDGRLHGVVVACRGEEGRWLMIRRGPGAAAARGGVCFPGGAIEVGESARDAVIREMREELGAEVEPVRRVWRFAFRDKPLTLHGWVGRLYSTPRRSDPKEVAEVLWLSTEQALAHPDILPHHEELFAALEGEV